MGQFLCNFLYETLSVVLITYRWKKCPYCKKRYEFESHSGATKGWEVEYFGSPTETCPYCLATVGTGKVEKISELGTQKKNRLFFSILFEAIGALIWMILISVIVAVVIGGYFTDNDNLGISLGFILFAFFLFNYVRSTIRDYNDRK